MKTTLTIITYDIPDDKRRTKIHKLLSGYGQWTQYSLFECWLSEKEWVRLRYEIESVGLAGEDSIRFYRLCATCGERVETLDGRGKPAEPLAFMI